MKFNIKKQLLMIWIIIVFSLLTMPMPPDINPVDSFVEIDKVVHFFLFGIFSFLVVFSYRDQYKNDGLFLMSVLLGGIYAALGEVVQVFFLTRTSSLNDFYAGVIGSLFFVILYYVGAKKT